MGVQITNLLTSRDTSIDELAGKTFAVDSYNMLYQFLTTLRTYDGSPLRDSKGNITSHISGLFSRTISFMSKGLKLAFVFDGEAPVLKQKERERRAEIKKAAEAQYEIAKERKDVEGMKKFAGRTARLTKEMVDETKELLEAFGLPVIQAPSEGEAQAARMCSNGDVYALISQDTDCLAFGTPRMVKNLSGSQRKKMNSKLSYESVKPQLLELEVNLKNLELTRDQLIALMMLVGTDFNIGGIKGIGPKNGLKLVKEHKDDFNTLFKEVKWSDFFDYDWNDVFNTIKDMPVTDDYKLEWKPINEDKIYEILHERHEFSKERIKHSLDKLNKIKDAQSQKGLGDFM